MNCPNASQNTVQDLNTQIFIISVRNFMIKEHRKYSISTVNCVSCVIHTLGNIVSISYFMYLHYD